MPDEPASKPCPARTLRRCALVALFAVVSVLALRFGVDRTGASQLGLYDMDWRKRLDAERALVAERRMPVLSGEALAENAAPRYRKALEAVSKADAALVASAVLLRAGDPLPPALARFLADDGSAAASLRDAVRCDRCDWELKYEDMWLTTAPRPRDTEALAAIVVLAAHERALAGDASGAADHDLALARFGVDLAQGHLVLHSLGARVVKTALGSLAGLVAKERASLPLEELDGKVAKLEAAFPSLGAAFRRERLIVGSFKALAEGDEPWWAKLDVSPGLVARVVPASFVLAHAERGIDSVLAESEAIAAIDDPVKRKADEDALSKRWETSWNPVLRFATPCGVRARRAADEARDAFALARSTIRSK